MATRPRRPHSRQRRPVLSKRSAVLAAVALVVVGSALIGGALTAAGRTSSVPAGTSTAVVAPAAPEAAVDASAPAAIPTPAEQTSAAPRPSSPAARPTTVKRAPSSAVVAKPVAKRRQSSPSVQRLSIAIGATGYEPARLLAKAGVPTQLTVGKGEGCAAGFEIPSLGVHLDNSAGPAKAQLGALKAGQYRYTCSMGMVSGTLVVR